MTDIVPTNTIGVYARLSSSNISSDSIYFGSKGSTDNRFIVGNWSKKLYFGWNDTTKDNIRPTIIENEIYNIELNFKNSRINKICTENDIANETYTYKEDITASLRNSTAPIAVFAGNYPSNLYKSKIKLYELNILEGTNIIHEFVPVYNSITESYGLYDKNNLKFYGNSGPKNDPNKADFIPGPEKVNN